MKTYLKLFVAVFFILIAVRSAKSDTYTVSGTVRYEDNNELVTAGHICLYDAETSELVSQGQIAPTGDYLLVVHRIVHLGEVIGFANNEEEADWVPTGYPNKVNAAYYVPVNVNQNLIGINIYVQRKPAISSPMLAKVTGTVFDKNNKPVKDAIVYAQNGNQYFGYGVTDSKGNYEMNVPTGDYIIIAHKVAHNSASAPVLVNQNGMDNINLVMNKNVKEYPGQVIPEKYGLSQNYPNPFNPSTVIKYSVPFNGQVSLRVYSSAGQEVSLLVNEFQQAGSYEISFNASYLSSGVYYYQITAGLFTETRKMTLIK